MNGPTGAGRPTAGGSAPCGSGVTSAQLASQAAPSGASLIGVQDAGNYFAGNHNLETVLQYIGANKNSFVLGLGQVVSIALTNNATNVVSRVENLSAASSGTAAAGFGLGLGFKLQNATGPSGAVVDAGEIDCLWDVATAGAEDSAMTFQVKRGGALVTPLRLSGSNAGAGRAPVELPLNNSSLQAMLVTSTGADSELAKIATNNKNFGLGTLGTGTSYMYAGGQFALALGSNGTVTDVKVGPNTALANNATRGFLHIPHSETTGVPTGVPALTTGFFNHSSAMLFNDIDGILYVRSNNAGKWYSFVGVVVP